MWTEGSSVVVIQNLGEEELLFWLGAGVLAEVLSLVRQILERAREEGYSRAHIMGRKGWEPILRREGWQTGICHLIKEIE